MTLENCQRLLKHFNDLADGTIPQPLGHKDWADVIANAKIRAKAMEERVTWKTSEGFRRKHNIPEPVVEVKETKPKEKKDGNSSNRS